MNGVNANPDAQFGNEERGIWHKRLRLRKTSFSFPTEQNTVKEEKNVTACGWKVTGKSKKWPRCLQAANTFTCSSCNDGISFRPGELTMHFKIAHGGKGSPPMFPCNMCGFSTPVFTTLQQHRMQHEDCLFACEICDDYVQQTLPQLTKHCQTHHALNGQYYCPKCKLSFQEIKQFVCHSSCISDGNARKNDLLKHMAAACRQRWSRKNWWRKRAHVKQDNNLSQGFKYLLPKPEPQWASPLLPFSTPGLLDNHGVLLDPEKTLEEAQQFLERTVCSGKNWPASLKSEQAATTSHPSQTNAKRWATPHTGKDKLSGLMEKNNISVPPDCTTKVVGFKMVGSKKHLVLKVIPSKKRDVSKDAHTVKPANQQDESNDISTINASGNCSQVTPRSSSSQTTKQGQCVAQRDFLSSVVERIKSQQTDGCNNQEHARNHNSHIQSPRAKRAKDCQDKALSESEENFTACQGDSGCHSDLTSDTGSLEERCGSRLLTTAFDEEHNLALDSNFIHHQPNTCSISGFDCVSPSSRSPLKDLTESLCQSEAGGLLLHGNADECTNNMDPRDSLVPVESRSAPDLLHMVDDLPLTTAIHFLDEVGADRTLSPHTSSDERLKDLTCAGGTSQRSDPVNASIFSLLPDDANSSTSVPETASGSSESGIPLASLNRKRMGETSSADSPVSKRSTRASEDVSASVLFWEPVPRDAPATLRLIPYSSSQSVKIPREYQPVIVLNHPDTDIPEVSNIMKVVHKHKDAVHRVVLSRKTLRALSEFNCDAFRHNLVANCHASHRRREWPNGTVKERLGLKLRLKRVCGRKYTVVPTVSESIVLQPTFRCWFCGRLFTNQEAWVGHGQRHLMEATRGWNQLFNR
ncbi:zinc finger protein 518A-like [Sinocyclocheilus rhinocerous]|uniref:zinc finger protein 518A-like n=1 Tax=Sinocyclocheilus rhinocerous TaxID=307959 RepID=UPI0007B7F82E|nr:PREDICTED: zinc finger protein 518A-like [Sinocyclocheilus rhinocerous]